MRFGPRSCTILLLLFSLRGPRLCAQDTRSTELSPARTGAVYAHALETTKSAHFTKLKGNSEWLWVTGKGVLTGTPDEHAPAKTEITVEASWQGHKFVRSFIIPVEPTPCPRGDGDFFAWCDDEGATAAARRLPEMKLDEVAGHDEGAAADGRPPLPQPKLDTEPPLGKDDRFSFELREPEEKSLVDPECPHKLGCILQFDRLGRRMGDKQPLGRFGHFILKANRIDWSQDLPLQDPLIKAVRGSKVFISGSVLIRTNVKSCAFWSWSVVTQTADSSNNLFYGPSDLTTFCQDNKTDPTNGTVLIVLPVHAIWASVYGAPANMNNPTWKPTPAPPEPHDCTKEKDTQLYTLPVEDIRPCDVDSNWLTRFYYWPPTAWEYNRLTLPGVSQGSISLAPWASGTKATWDVQAYESTRLGPGWLGLQLTYEHDRKLADDLNSLTAALTYDVRIYNKKPFWFDWGAQKGQSKGCKLVAKGDECSPPLVGVRPLEVNVRGGPEWSPSAENTGASAQGLYMAKDLNLVSGATARLPIIISPIGLNNKRQPSQFTFVPVLGFEGGFRVNPHPICADETLVPVNGTSPCVRSNQPREIFRRVAGVDASVRFPYNLTKNFLGDRPMTLDFSYRLRLLSYAEPFYYDTQTTIPATKTIPAIPAMALPEVQSKGERSYMRITFIAPISAYLQMRASWQHGSLPPLFQYVGSEVTLGLAFSNPGSSEH